jgi:hypothetical protein
MTFVTTKPRAESRKALDPAGFVAFVRMSLGLGGGGAARRHAFLALERAEAKTLIDGKSASGGLAKRWSGLKLYLGAAGHLPPLPSDRPMRGWRCGASPVSAAVAFACRRPSRFCWGDAKTIYRGALAHVRAHPLEKPIS